MTRGRGVWIATAFLTAGIGACSSAQEESASGDGPGAAEEAPEPAPAPQEADEPNELERTGRVVVSGPEGLRMVTLSTGDGGSIGLAGDLLDELMQLSGAVVAVAGSPAQTLQEEGVEVTGYEVVSIDGQTPIVGELTEDGSALRLESGETLELVGVPDELAPQVGAKIWVTGPETPEGRRVQSYGVIRPAG